VRMPSHMLPSGLVLPSHIMGALLSRYGVVLARSADILLVHPSLLPSLLRDASPP
jgi:hypothetical protein